MYHKYMYFVTDWARKCRVAVINNGELVQAAACDRSIRIVYLIVYTLHCQQYCWVSALETLHYVYDAIAVSYRVCFVLTEGPSCNMTQFLCDNGTCISGSLYCDGVDNCGDGSDERRCGKMIVKNATTYTSVNC